MLDCRRGHKPPKRSGITKCRNREQSAKTLPEHLGEAELVSRFHCPGSLSLAPQTRMAHRAPLLRSTIWVLEPGTRGRVTHRDDAAALEGPFLGQGASTHQRPEVGQSSPSCGGTMGPVPTRCCLSALRKLSFNVEGKGRRAGLPAERPA